MSEIVHIASCFFGGCHIRKSAENRCAAATHKGKIGTVFDKRTFYIIDDRDFCCGDGFHYVSRCGYNHIFVATAYALGNSADRKIFGAVVQIKILIHICGRNRLFGLDDDIRKIGRRKRSQYFAYSLGESASADETKRYVCAERHAYFQKPPTVNGIFKYRVYSV